MNQKIQNILNELFLYDPSLKAYEKELEKIISQLLASEPNLNYDENFFQNLKQKLELRIQERQNSKISLANFTQKKWFAFGSFAFASLAIVLISVISLKSQNNSGDYSIFGRNSTGISENSTGETDPKKMSVQAFASSEEYLAYLKTAQNTTPVVTNSPFLGRGGGVMMEDSFAPLAKSTSMTQNSLATSPEMANRISQTNTQVLNIDEPDILKTNGKQIFYSSQSSYGIYPQTMFESPVEPEVSNKIGIVPPRPYQTETKVINTLPVSELKKIGKIERQGDLLLSGNTLIVLNYEGVFGYNISTPENPIQQWSIKYTDTQFETARLMNGKLYLVTKSYLNYELPCPLKPLMHNETPVEIRCQNIFRPIRPASDSASFNAFLINPETGNVENNLSFIGSFGQSITYMSENNLYITFSQNKPQLEIIIDFLKTSGKNLLPDEIVTKLEKVQNYDISEQAKQIEIEQVLQKYINSKDKDEQIKIRNQIQNKLSDYFKINKRKLVTSGILKINLKDFKISATSQVPGTALNQFSLDEYKGNLRIATTIGENFWLWNFTASNTESANDLYVLDKNLNQIGSITNLGLSEKIYSARFIEERAYVVTFRQTDPFYVLDLSDPKNPKKKGELKIPGYSSYLHPLTENTILGLGQENGKVKLSLFNIQDPENPVELDKYNLDEYWSEAQSNHHAFLQDSKYSAFFLPGSQGGFIFSYKDNKLNLEKVISEIGTKRAVYINDHLYIVSDNKIVVLKEGSWEKVKELDLNK
jgi:inhibitor of cysteine peptidase